MAWVKKFGSAANSGGLGLLLEVGGNDLHPTITIISCCSIIQNGSTFFCQLIQIVLATGCSTSEVVVAVVAVTAAAVICRSIYLQCWLVIRTPEGYLVHRNLILVILEDFLWKFTQTRSYL